MKSFNITNAIVNSENFIWVNAIIFFNNITCKITHWHYQVGIFHAALFSFINPVPAGFSAAVNLKRMNMNNKRFTRNTFYFQSGK